jgi:hypothetical protein
LGELTTDFRSSEKKTFNSGPMRISSFLRQQRGKSKLRKTFVANDTLEKTLNSFSLDRKPVVYIPVLKSPGDVSEKGIIQETSPGLNLEKFARVSKNLRKFSLSSGSLSARRQNNEMFSFDRRKPPVSALGTGISQPSDKL